MRILYVNCEHYDYMTATLIEGLAALGHEVGCTRSSNYGQALPETEIVPFGDHADIIVIGTASWSSHHWLNQITNPRKVAVDGTDVAAFEIIRTVPLKAVFKRELCKVERIAPTDFIFALPFAAENRYFIPPMAKDVQVSFVATMATNPIRNSIHVRLLNRQNPAIISGWTNERSYSAGAPQPNPIETPGYRTLLARSQISINAPGAGYDCARYWEILAAQALLLTFTPDIAIPDGFTDGVDCITFDSVGELDAKLDFCLANRSKVAEIAESGYSRLLSHHTTAKRAEYFLKQALPAAQREGHCERFYAP